MSQWRVLVGMDVDDPSEPVRVDIAHPTWDAARSALTEHIRSYWLAPPDDCAGCVRDAEVALSELAEAVPDRSFTGVIEGDDYALRPA